MPADLSFATVSIAEVPPPTGRDAASKYQRVFSDLLLIPDSQAAKLSFTKEATGYAARAVLKKIAKKHDRILNASCSADKLTFYFWLEPKR